MTAPSTESESATATTGRLAPLVLVVDDDPLVLEIEAEALEKKGYRVAQASNGEEALARVAEQQPQLVLLDMRLPVMDGWTVSRVLRDRYGRRIPIVIVTAAEDSSLRAAEVGADADLGKPFGLAELYQVVSDIVGEP